MSSDDKPLVWLHGDIKTLPFSAQARAEAGYLLRMLQKGHPISPPRSRPMATIGRRVHELRINDRDNT
jgi:phage-related protein